MSARQHSLYTSVNYVSYQSEDNISVAEAWEDIYQCNKTKEMSKRQWTQKNAEAGLLIIFAQISSYTRTDCIATHYHVPWL